MGETDAKGDGDNLGPRAGDAEAGYCVQDAVSADVAVSAMSGCIIGVKAVTRGDMVVNGSCGGC